MEPTEENNTKTQQKGMKDYINAMNVKYKRTDALSQR